MMYMNPGEMFLGCLGAVEQRFLCQLFKTAREAGYTRFVEPCAGTFAMSNLAVDTGYKTSQLETSDVSMMPTILGYSIMGKPLDELEIKAKGFSDEELLDPATALYAQLYLRTAKKAGTEYFHNLLNDLSFEREKYVAQINEGLARCKARLGGMITVRWICSSTCARCWMMSTQSSWSIRRRTSAATSATMTQAV